MSGDDGYRLFVDDKLVAGDWGNHSLSSRTAFFDVKKGQDYTIRFEFFDNASDAIVKLKIGMFNESAFNAAVAKADESSTAEGSTAISRAKASTDRSNCLRSKGQ